MWKHQSYMKHGQCSKKYPKTFVSETQLCTGSYPLYKKRSPEDGGQVSTINVRGNRITQEIDNWWVVPYPIPKPSLIVKKGEPKKVQVTERLKSVKSL